MEQEKTRFRNTTDGYLGVCVFDEGGQKTAISVAPRGEVELSPAEQRMTAHAPRDPANSPFADGTGENGGPALVEVTKGRPVPADDQAGKRPKRRSSRRQSEDEHGAAAAPAGDAPEGSYEQGETVGTPDAPKAA